MKAEIIAVGSELLLGQTVDTNSTYIAQQLTTIGLDLHYKATVGDNLDRLKATLQNALNRSDFVITTGGIGPTLDDVTREAVAEALGRPLVFQPHLYDQISNYFQRMGRTVGPNNRKQAFIPMGAIPIENPVGTAPGFIAEIEEKAIITVPGVPHEMRYFMEHSVLPYLRQKLGIREVIISRVLKLMGIGESLVDDKLKDLIEAGVNPTIGLLAHTQIGEIHIRLTAKAGDPAEARAKMAPLETEIRSRLGDFIFGADEETYEGVLGCLLRQERISLAAVETVFGSSVIQTLKSMEGNQDFFCLGLTLMNAKAAGSILDLPENFFADPGMGSREGAEILAQRVRRLAGANLGLCLTGLAARKKEEDHQIYIALADSLRTESWSQRFPFTMRFIENRITKLTLEQVRKYLLVRVSERKG